MVEYFLIKVVSVSSLFSVLLVTVLVFAFGVFLGKFVLSFANDTSVLLDNLLKETLHELNIPIATILANVKLLKKGESDLKKIKRLQRIQKASNQLERLYKSLDYYIKKEIQKVEYEIFDAKEAVNEAIGLVEGVRKNIEIKKEIKSVFIKCDKEGFIKSIINLLSNAIKYNKDNGWVKVILKDEVLIIEDGGIGMEESELVKIFERFYQIKKSKDGYGLGLSIVKSFCDENKIKISIFSKKGTGTRVALSLKNILA